MGKHDDTGRTIVFLHLPKTGGQTIHHAVGSLVGGKRISPYRLMSQVEGGTPFPDGYRMHSGHLDWLHLEEIPGDPFSFTVLRDPRERLGSFFFFMREEAQKGRAAKGLDALPPVQQAILRGASEVFFSDDPRVRAGVMLQWWNATLTYLATRTLRRTAAMQKLPVSDLLARAEENARALSAIYRFGEFEKIEDDIEAVVGKRPKITGKRSNPGPLEPGRGRWAALLEELETDAQRRGIEDFVAEDLELMERIAYR